MKDIKRILISENEIRDKVEVLGSQISKDYEGEEVVLICVLKGSVVFLADLIRNISIPITIDFLQVESYQGTKQMDTVKIIKDISENIQNKSVLIIEDIIDTGITLNIIIKHLKTKNPKDLKICALLDKEEGRIIDINIDYYGFKIPNKFVVGYGLDYNQRYRNLPYIGMLNNTA